MITEAEEILPESLLEAELVVIGAGPAGIVTALEAGRRGISVLLLESGERKADAGIRDLSVAGELDDSLHAPLEMTVSRQLGGTSAIWGGRCVPYDPIDFLDRPYLPNSPWPISFGDLEKYQSAASLWMKAGRAVFDATEMPHLRPTVVPRLVDGDVRGSSVERWSRPTNFGKVYHDELESSPNVRVLLGATCIRLPTTEDDREVAWCECVTMSGHRFRVSGSTYVLAAGGLETTRLLLSSPTHAGHALGDHSGHLGHWYMAHMEGVIADVEFAGDPKETVYDYERDIDGTYIRRRFTFASAYLQTHDLPNISAWIANADLADASHASAELSLSYLTLISPLGHLFAPDAQRLSLTGTRIPGCPYGQTDPSPLWQHVRNVVMHPLAVLRFLRKFALRRVFAPGRKPPGFFVYKADNRYPFHYQGEHLPKYDSEVSLSDAVDDVGMRRLKVDLRISDEDVDGVVRAHEHWDAYLRAHGVGRLRYIADDLREAVRERAGGGFHQIGTTRMSASPDDGVVDEHLRIHGMRNVHVVSSSVFPTSGQANSTFTVVAFAVRLVEELYGKP